MKHIFLFFYLVTFFVASLPMLYINYIQGNVVGVLSVILGMIIIIGAIIALYMEFNYKVQIAINLLGLVLFGMPAGLPFLLTIFYWIVKKYILVRFHI